MHGTMSYMARDPQTRSSVDRWFPPARSVVLLGFSYADGRSPDPGPDPGSGRVARYARSKDYHPELRTRLKRLLERIQEAAPGARGKAFIDTSAVLERLYARYAGLGWVGKNTMLISPKAGSYFFIAGIALDRELEYDEPAPDHCGTCDRCLRACPTQAFPRPHVLDASRCIAYLTIEHRGSIPEGLREGVGDWAFGCDVCQEVCPWNRFSVRSPVFVDKVPARLPLARLTSLGEEEFRRDFADTPLERAGRAGLARNALLVMGNSGDPSHRPSLEEAAAGPETLAAEQARWSLARLTRATAAVLLLAAAGSSWAAEARRAPRTPRPRSLSPRTTTPPEGPTPVPEVPPGLKKAAEKPADQPFPLNWIVRPIERGMFIRLPIMDTDPNRGITFGFMPIWVIKEDGSDRIRQIHAPSLTYNNIFKEVPTYRFYYYPTPEANLIMRAAWSRISDREMLGHFEDFDFLGRDLYFNLKLQYNVDGAHRFFGLGPDSPKDGEANYRQDTLQYHAGFGIPLRPESRWNVTASHRLAGERIADGPIDAVPDLTARYPAFAPARRSQDAEWRLAFNYDSRDNHVTTRQGLFMDLFSETSQKEMLSQYDFNRYGADFRVFHPWKDSSLGLPAGQDTVTAARLKFEQIVGNAPFWLLPQLGGKYIHRAYGEGRYIDKGLVTATAEQHFVLFKAETAGVTTEYGVDPFIGVGTVFDTPGTMQRRLFRPVYGVAVRAVARPQVVGSIDFGLGQEGLAAFMDINYSF